MSEKEKNKRVYFKKKYFLHEDRDADNNYGVFKQVDMIEGDVQSCIKAKDMMFEEIQQLEEVERKVAKLKMDLNIRYTDIKFYIDQLDEDNKKNVAF